MSGFITNIPKITTEEGDNLLFPFSPPIFQTEVDPKFTKELIEEGRKLTIKEDDFSNKLAESSVLEMATGIRFDFSLCC